MARVPRPRLPVLRVRLRDVLGEELMLADGLTLPVAKLVLHRRSRPAGPTMPARRAQPPGVKVERPCLQVLVSGPGEMLGHRAPMQIDVAVDGIPHSGHAARVLHGIHGQHQLVSAYLCILAVQPGREVGEITVLIGCGVGIHRGGTSAWLGVPSHKPVPQMRREVALPLDPGPPQRRDATPGGMGRGGFVPRGPCQPQVQER